MCKLMKFYLFFIVFLIASCNRNLDVKSKMPLEVDSSGLKYQVIIETIQDSSFTLMYESLKYMKPDYQKNKLKLVKPKFERDVKYPSTYTTSEQINKKILPIGATKISGESTAGAPIPFPSGLCLYHRLSSKDEVIYIFISEFESKALAKTYVSLIEESKYYRRGSKSIVLSEDEAIDFFIEKFMQQKR